MRDSITRCQAYLMICWAITPSSFHSRTGVFKIRIAPLSVSSGTNVVSPQNRRFKRPCVNLSNDVESVLVMEVRSFTSCRAYSSRK